MFMKTFAFIVALTLVTGLLPTVLAQTAAPQTVTDKETLQVDTTLFKAAFPGGTWAENEGWRFDREGYSAVRYDLKDESGANVASVSLKARSEGVRKYRDKLKSLRDLALQAGKDGLVSLTISGIVFQGAEYEQSGETIAEYAARVPESSYTLTVIISHPGVIGEDLPGILGTVAFTLPTLTPPNADPPEPEDGVPYKPTPGSLALGDRQITASWVKPDKPIVAERMFNNHIALLDSRLYALAGETLYAFTLKGDTLAPDLAFAGGQMTLDEPTELKNEYLSPGKNGLLFVSQGRAFILRVKNGFYLGFSEVRGYVVMHPSGEWGISHWMSTDPHRVRVYDGDLREYEGALREEPWVLSNLSDNTARKGRFSSIYHVSITQERIYIAGTDAETGNAHRVAAFDLDGRELFTFGGQDQTAEDTLVLVTGVAETPAGILVLDGSNRSIKLFTMQGDYLASLDSDSLFGTANAWLSSVVMDGDDTLIASVQAREDGSANELLIFRVKGF